MAVLKELQRKNQELIGQNLRLERELQKKEKALAEAAALLLQAIMFGSLWPQDGET
jgi:hypothetical protein